MKAFVEKISTSQAQFGQKKALAKKFNVIHLAE